MSGSLGRGGREGAAAKSRSDKSLEEMIQENVCFCFSKTPELRTKVRGVVVAAASVPRFIFFPPRTFFAPIPVPFPALIIPSSPAAWPLFPSLRLTSEYKSTYSFSYNENGQGKGPPTPLNYMPKGPSPSSPEKLSYNIIVPWQLSPLPTLHGNPPSSRLRLLAADSRPAQQLS